MTARSLAQWPNSSLVTAALETKNDVTRLAVTLTIDDHRILACAHIHISESKISAETTNTALQRLNEAGPGEIELDFGTEVSGKASPLSRTAMADDNFGAPSPSLSVHVRPVL